MNDNQSILLPMSQLASDAIQLQQIVIQAMFWVQKQTKSVAVVLTSQMIALGQPYHYVHYIPLQFQLKFQIIYSTPGDVKSSKLGFRLIKDNHDTIEFKTYNEGMANAWAVCLGKRLNQIGFHQLYKPIRKVGKGGFATVYQVERISDGMHFAVKAFSKQNTLNSTNTAQRDSLLNEIKMLRSFNSSSVLQAQAVFESDNSLYVVQELLSAGQLHSLINRRQGKFTLGEIRQIMRGLLGGLAQINSKRVMHRDIKPQNIMMRSQLEPVIADFGLSSHVDSQDYLFYRCGTPGYVAPQITTLVQGQHVEATCDVFSAGVIFHILLTGRPLFSGRKFQEVYENNRKMRFDLSLQSYDKIDTDAFNLLKKMLIENPAERITAKNCLEHPFLFGFEGFGEKVDSPTATLASNKARRVV